MRGIEGIIVRADRNGSLDRFGRICRRGGAERRRDDDVIGIWACSVSGPLSLSRFVPLLVIHILIIEVEDPDHHVISRLCRAVGIDGYGLEIAVQGQTGR